MPSKQYLNEAEKVIITTLKAESYSNRAIAQKINRSHSVVNNFLKKGSNYGKKMYTKGNTKVSNRQKNQLIKVACTGNFTSRQLVSELELPIKKSQVCSILNKSGKLKYTKKIKAPFLKPHHETARLDWAKKHMNWTTEWCHVVFSDEKKFNLDGPDGCHYYWHDLSKEKKFKFSRNFGGGSLMVWAAFSAFGKTPILKVRGRMNSNQYIDMIEDVLINFSDEKMDGDFIFQQDNASIHVSKLSREWFQSKEIDLLDWPACSPDLNPIENLWGILVRLVYQGGRQYKTVQELEVAINNSWREIRIGTLENLVNSMPNRVFEVINKNGKKTKY